MKNRIKVTKYLQSRDQEIILGPGAKLKISKATDPIIRFLADSYANDKECIKGDIGGLLARSVQLALQKEKNSRTRHQHINDPSESE